jgi:vacuolar-type H+-ATPase subunit C/Vma6
MRALRWKLVHPREMAQLPRRPPGHVRKLVSDRVPTGAQTDWERALWKDLVDDHLRIMGFVQGPGRSVLGALLEIFNNRNLKAVVRSKIGGERDVGLLVPVPMPWGLPLEEMVQAPTLDALEGVVGDTRYNAAFSRGLGRYRDGGGLAMLEHPLDVATLSYVRSSLGQGRMKRFVDAFLEVGQTILVLRLHRYYGLEEDAIVPLLVPVGRLSRREELASWRASTGLGSSPPWMGDVCGASGVSVEPWELEACMTRALIPRAWRLLFQNVLGLLPLVSHFWLRVLQVRDLVLLMHGTADGVSPDELHNLVWTRS